MGPYFVDLVVLKGTYARRLVRKSLASHRLGARIIAGDSLHRVWSPALSAPRPILKGPEAPAHFHAVAASPGGTMTHLHPILDATRAGALGVKPPDPKKRIAWIMPVRSGPKKSHWPRHNPHADLRGTMLANSRLARAIACDYARQSRAKPR